jgi:hypothetical protein
MLAKKVTPLLSGAISDLMTSGAFNCPRLRNLFHEDNSLLPYYFL